MLYGATVGASAANSNLIKLKKNIFIPVLNKSYVHCDFQSDLLTMLMNLNCLFVVDIWYSHQRTCYRSKSTYMYIYCHVVNFKFTT